MSSEQMAFLYLVVKGSKRVLFTGVGTDKSLLICAVISKLKERYVRDPEQVAVTASAGLAARSIGGITLHSFSGMSYYGLMRL